MNILVPTESSKRHAQVHTLAGRYLDELENTMLELAEGLEELLEQEYGFRERRRRAEEREWEKAGGTE